MVAILENKIFYANAINPTSMKYIGLLFILTSIWIAYEIWRAPMMEETDDGKLITKRPAKKLSDLWRKRS